MEDTVIQGFMNQAIYQEIIPTLTLPKEELEDFAASVTERFKNPYIDPVSYTHLDVYKRQPLHWMRGNNFTKISPVLVSVHLLFYTEAVCQLNTLKGL